MCVAILKANDNSCILLFKTGYDTADSN